MPSNLVTADTPVGTLVYFSAAENNGDDAPYTLMHLCGCGCGARELLNRNGGYTGVHDPRYLRLTPPATFEEC